jgi:TonB family protein
MFCLLALPAVSAAQDGGPLLKSDLVRMMTASNYTSTEMAAIVRMNCVGFEPTPRDRNQLGGLPNADVVLAEVDRCMSRPRTLASGDRRAAEPVEVAAAPTPPRPDGRIVLDGVGVAPTEALPTELSAPDGASQTLQAPVNPRLVSRETPPELTNWKDVSAAFLREYRPNVRTPGKVLLWLRIDAEGDVTEVRVKKASGDPVMADAAVRITKVMKFSPATMRGRPVESWTELPIDFTAK